MPDEDHSMEIWLGKDKPPSMKDFTNLEKIEARKKALTKYTGRLNRLPKKYPNLFTEEVRKSYLLRDFIDIAIDAITEEVYFEGNFQEVLLETAKIILADHPQS